MDKATPLHSQHHYSGSGSHLMNMMLKDKQQARSILPLHNRYSSPDQQQQQQQQHRSNSDSPSHLRRVMKMTHRHHNSSNSNQQQKDDDPTSLLPVWSANPQSPLEDSNNNNNNTTTPSSPRNSPTFHLTASPSTATTGNSSNHNHNNHSNNHNYASMVSRHGCCGCSWTTLLYSVLLGVGIAMALKSRVSLSDSMNHLNSLLHNGRLLHDKLLDANKGIKLLQRQVSAYDVMLQHQQQQPQQETLHDNNNNINDINNINNNQVPVVYNRALLEMQQLDARLRKSQERANWLKKQVQALSKKEALQKYGDHVHRVEIELAFPDQRPGPTKFVIEMAPLDVMPHSVHYFLEMAQSGLLDGCSFILNALHVLKAAPLPYDGSSAASKARAFARMGLESVAFKEYSPSYPHEQYTVGFAADGSPSFYINTEDNSEIHLGDPCFGKIVEGFDTVKRLEASPTRNGIWFEQRIGIHRATVLM